MTSLRSSPAIHDAAGQARIVIPHEHHREQLSTIISNEHHREQLSTIARDQHHREQLSTITSDPAPSQAIQHHCKQSSTIPSNPAPLRAIARDQAPSQGIEHHREGLSAIASNLHQSHNIAIEQNHTFTIRCSLVINGTHWPCKKNGENTQSCRSCSYFLQISSPLLKFERCSPRRLSRFRHLQALKVYHSKKHHHFKLS